MGKSCNFMEPASLDSRRPKGKVVSSGEEAGIGSYKSIANYLKSDASKTLDATKESGGDDGLQFPTQIQFGVSQCMHNIKACDTSANSVPQRGSWCHDEIFKEESWKFPTVRNHGHKLPIDAVSNSAAHLISSGLPRNSHCSTKVGFLSSYANSSKANPSFEFFVVSEEGINLYVDLNSIPSEWITSLKDEVCIDERLHHQSLANPTRCFSDSGQHMKASLSENSELNLQSNGVETNTGCTNSSLCSVVSENCQSEIHPLDTTVASSGSFIITPTSYPTAETPEILERTKGVSSPCIAYSNFENSKIVDDIVSSQERTLIHQDSIDVSSRTVESNPSAKSNADEIPCANIETTECHSPKFQKTDDNVEVATENNSAFSVCKKINLSEIDEILESSKIIANSTVENQMTVEDIDLEGDSRCNNMESSCHHGKPPDFDQLGNSLPEGPASRYENSRKSNLPKRKSNSLQIQNALDNKVSKRYRSSEFNEEHDNKRDDSVGDSKNTKSPIKENVNDLAVLRRRSSRLLSK